MRKQRIPEMSLKDRVEQLRGAYGDNACWPWPGAKSDRGYASVNSKTVPGCTSRYGHRLVYTLVKGPIPPGLTLDHLCRNTMCVNPAHLEPVTKHINQLRSGDPKYLAFVNGTCIRGHKVEKGIYCRICRNKNAREWRAANPERASAIGRKHGAKRRATEAYKAYRKAYDRARYLKFKASQH